MDAASGIKVTDSLPAGVVLQSATGNGWTCAPAGQTVTCTRPSLPAGTAPSITITITVRAPSDAVVLTDTASVTSTSSDLDGSNNATTLTTFVQPVADLSLAVTDAPDPVTAGSALAARLGTGRRWPGHGQTGGLECGPWQSASTLSTGTATSSVLTTAS